MVIVLLAHEAVTPAGKPVTVPIPVAPVVVWVILVRSVLIHTVEVVGEAAVAVIIGVTVTANVRAALAPQLFVAITLIFPLTAPVPGVAEIVLAVELPVHPVGNVHL